MIRKMRKLAVLISVLCLISAMMAVNVFAADEYEWKITLDGGNGTVSGLPSDPITSVEVVPDGDTNVVKVNGSPVTVDPASDKYFVIGVKKAGHDNSELLQSVSLSNEKQDTPLVVAYGLKSNMVKYNVYYRDAATGGSVSGLPDSEEHYGVKGSKPVVSYKYADSYLPEAYNLTGSLSDGKNEFTFWYYKVNEQGEVVTIVDGVPAGTAANNAGAGTNIGDNATPLAGGPADTIDIDDTKPPTTDGKDNKKDDGKDIDDNKTPLSAPLKIACAAAIIAAIAAAALIIVKRRAEDEEDDQ